MAAPTTKAATAAPVITFVPISPQSVCVSDDESYVDMRALHSSTDAPPSLQFLYMRSFVDDAHPVNKVTIIVAEIGFILMPLCIAKTYLNPNWILLKAFS